MTRILFGCFSALGMMAVLGGSRAASAHGGTFRADQILVDPTDAKHVVVASDVWGYGETHDGAIWQWFCAEAYGGDSLNVLRRSMVFLPQGDLLVANKFGGLRRSRGTLCELDPVPFFAEPGRCGPSDCLVADVASAPSSPASVVVLTLAQDSSGGLQNRLWHSADAESWSALPDTVPSDIGVASVAVAPTDSSRIYLGAKPLSDETTLLVLASSDGGASFTRTPVALPPLDPNEPPVTLTVYGVHRVDPSLVFFRVDRGDVSRATGRDRVLVSADGGRTVTTVFEGAGDLPGFTVSLDDATVFAGGPTDGLWSASVADMRAGAPQAFRQVSRDPVWGLLSTADGLLAGHDDFAQPPSVPFSLGLSSDGGATFAPRMTVCELSPADCPTGTVGATSCPALFDGISNFQYDFQSQRCLPPSTLAEADGGQEMRNRGLVARGAGCSCRGAAVDRDASLSKLPALLALGVATFLRRRRLQLVRGAAAPPNGDTA